MRFRLKDFLSLICMRGGLGEIEMRSVGVDVFFIVLNGRFFILVITSGITMGGQKYFFAGGAATLTTRWKKVSFVAIMRQDG